MSDDAVCLVCAKPLLPGEGVASGEDVHARCDRRRRSREGHALKCIVCNEPIRSQDGTARLGDVLVHGACYVRARQPARKATAEPEHAATAPDANGSAREGSWVHRLLRRVFGSRKPSGAAS